MNTQSNSNNLVWIRRLSKLTCFSTLFLIFAGGMVTSTGSGLSVPDWPLSYGTFFPPMVGGVFYEHGHRMIASTVGFMMLILSICLWKYEKRSWLKKLGAFALFAVIAQGVLGGLTVLFFLPRQISISHAVLAQSFFILTILIAYSLSIERADRVKSSLETIHPNLFKINFLLIVFIYVQLILGALMRHTHSGLAIPDFPTMGGMLVPTFNESMLKTINLWQFEHNLDYVTMSQIMIHFIHRVWAIIILIIVCILNLNALKLTSLNQKIKQTMFWLNCLILWQISLGIFTVLTIKSPTITSLHVASGAATLGLSVLLLLRLSPLTFSKFKLALSNKQ